MNIAELLANEELRAHEFPVVREKIFLAHAGDCPLPRRVAEAIGAYARQAATGDQESIVYPAIIDQGRQVAARLLSCQPDEVSFVGPTSLALSLVAGGLRFRRGDNILVYFDDYPSNVYPWLALAERGVEVRLMNTRGLGFIRPRDVIGQIDENTRLIALASCHFISGFRLEIDAIGKALHDRNILFCLDGIQTLGAFPVSVEHVDILAADAHKWLLGPCGAGVLYVRQSIQPRINPSLYGWNNVLCPDFVAQEQIVFQQGAKKFEAGSHNLLGIVGLIEAMNLVLETGVEAIGCELLRKRAWLVPALQARGCNVLQPDAPPPNASGIISFSLPGSGENALHQKLLDHGIITSLRTDRSGRKFIRLSPHFYNTDAELQRLLDLV
ncbi:MAG TPA: aminotransferase class V-fold PLP-dependent enzyme [Clostridia bacterium]|nr:aminotransferase class V-fold PLP-dependent enzyme [Clostridia bacterium]